jgi:aspartate kinase
MKVAKFGGSSLASAERIKSVCDIVAADKSRRIVVVSAPGKASAADTKVTDLLIACAKKHLETGSAKAEMKAVVDRYAALQCGLGLSPDILRRIEADLTARLTEDTADPARFIDTMKAAGEDNCAWLVAEAMRQRGIDAHYVHPGEAGMLLSSEFGDARVLEESYAKLGALKDAPGITVFPGFFGVTLEGAVVTLPRGGSDITGAVLAAAVKAELYENFTDVDSVFSADHRVVPDAKPIQVLTYDEMRELSYAGFGVFHDEAIVPAVEAGIPICIRNTHRPEAPGTMVVPKRDHEHCSVVGIASSDGFCSMLVKKYMMNRELGFGRRLLEILEDEGLSYEHTPSGIDNMSVILSESELTLAVEKRVLARVSEELKAESDVERGLALIMIVGEGMRYSVGVAARATGALASAEVNIEMMNQGSSEISMMFGVKSEDKDKAVRALYAAFFDA